MKIVAIIPARYNSSRFPGKPLVKINEKTMINLVYNQVKQLQQLDEVVVATDDSRILDEVLSFGGKVILTPEFNTGTDRVAYAAKHFNADIVINIQGDEPLISTESIIKLIECFNDENVQMATLKKEIHDSNEIDNPNIVKIITNEKDYAIYFSRSKIPFNRNNLAVKYYKHIGIYGYRNDFLQLYVTLKQPELEISESLEQLRALYYGYNISVAETFHDSIGVDTPEDIEKVLKHIGKVL